MIVHPTQKLAKKLGLKDLAALGPEVPGLDSWYANLIRLGRVQYILLTNVPSLFSVVLPGRGITKPAHLFKGLDEVLADTLGRVGLWEPYQAILETHNPAPRLFKTANRSVLGCMNDMLMHCEHYSANKGADLPGMADYLNIVIHQPTGYQRPIEHFTRLVLGREALPAPNKTGQA